MYSNNTGQQIMPLQPGQQQSPPSSLESEQPGRKRTKKDRACDLCRRKKIRCDYDQAYPQQPCTSCKSYKKMCTFEEAAKKRGPPKGYVEGLENRLKRMEKLLLNIASNGNLPPETIKTALEEVEGVASTSSSHSDSPGQSTIIEHDLAKVKNNSQPLENLSPDNNNTTEKSKNEPFSYVGSSSGIYLLSRLFPKDQASIRPDASGALPRPLEGHEDDLMVARFGRDKLIKLGFSRNAGEPDWKLPSKELTDYLIELYFKRINSLLPILDEEEFYTRYHTNQYDSAFIPIIMTICKITCRLLKTNEIQKYQVDRIAFYKDIQKQLELYFDLDFLEPKIETIQVLLLNASNAEKWGLASEDWISTSIAVKMAQDLGLHRANAQQVSKKEVESKKRLWWSAYVIDRWIGSSLGRPLTVSDADCDVEYPDAHLNEQFMYLVKLSCILGDILRALCSPRARMMSEKSGLGLENMSRNLEQAVVDWKRSLPEHLDLTDEELERISRKEIDMDLQRKIDNGAGKLRFAYCAVYLLSKRPFISMGSGQGSTIKMPLECQQVLRISVDLFEVIEVTELFCGWSLSSYCLSQTKVLLLLNYRNRDANLIQESKCLCDRFKNRHRALEEYIAEPSIIPFLDLLSKVISGDDESSSTLDGDDGNTTGQDEIHDEQQVSLWGASGGIEWQEMVKLLAETGYQN